jgi:putative SOS response-associated peptidase YedK
MCGRYASARSRIELLEEFAVERDRVDEPLRPDYNVAPTKPVYAVMTRAPRAEPGQTQRQPQSPEPNKPVRELRVVRWGLVPYWAKDTSIGSRMINARAETVSEKPAFRSAFAKRRCLLPADGYYEWQPPPAGAKGPKQPYYICRRDHSSLAFAGLYELWRDRSLAPAGAGGSGGSPPDRLSGGSSPRASTDDPAAWLWTTTIITTTAPDELGEIHDRMPMVIDRARWTDWLDPGNTDVADVRALLAPAATTGLISYPVAALVNSVRNNGPELIEQADPVAPGLGGRPDA